MKRLKDSGVQSADKEVEHRDSQRTNHPSWWKSVLKSESNEKIMVLGNGLLVNKSFLRAPKFLLKTESSYRWKQFVTFTSNMLSKDVIHNWKEEDLDGRSDTVCNEYSLCTGVQLLHLGKFVFQQKKSFFFSLLLLFHQTRPADWKVQRSTISQRLNRNT